MGPLPWGHSSGVGSLVGREGEGTGVTALFRWFCQNFCLDVLVWRLVVYLVGGCEVMV